MFAEERGHLLPHFHLQLANPLQFFFCENKMAIKRLPYPVCKDSSFVKTMSSREIAVLTGKQHKNIIADIRNMLKSLKIDKYII